MDQKTKKVMTIQKALHPRDDLGIIYVPRTFEEEDSSAWRMITLKQFEDD